MILAIQNVRVNEKYKPFWSEMKSILSDISRNIKERMQTCLRQWKSKMFSQAGRGIFIKIVVLAIPTYTMSIAGFIVC